MADLSKEETFTRNKCTPVSDGATEETKSLSKFKIGYTKFVAVICESAVFFGVLSGITSATEQLLGKLLATDLGPLQYMLYRFTAQTSIIWVLIITTKGSFKVQRKEYTYTIIRCLSVNLFYLLAAFSYMYISFLDVIIFYIAFSFIASLILSRVVLKERLHVFTVIMMIIIMTGIIILGDPWRLMTVLLEAYKSRNHSYYIGVVWISMAGILNAVSATANKCIKETSNLTTAFYISVSGLGFTSIVAFLPIDRKFSVDGYVILGCILCSCISLISTLTFIQGLRKGTLMELMLSTEIEIPFSIVLQLLIFPDTILPPLKIIAIIMIIIGIVFINIREWIFKKLFHTSVVYSNL